MKYRVYCILMSLVFLTVLVMRAEADNCSKYNWMEGKEIAIQGQFSERTGTKICTNGLSITNEGENCDTDSKGFAKIDFFDRDGCSADFYIKNLPIEELSIKSGDFIDLAVRLTKNLTSTYSNYRGGGITKVYAYSADFVRWEQEFGAKKRQQILKEKLKKYGSLSVVMVLIIGYIYIHFKGSGSGTSQRTITHQNSKIESTIKQSSSKKEEQVAIGNAIQRGSAIYIYDEKGRTLGTIPAGDGLQGFTSSIVNVKRGSLIYSYDKKGRVVGSTTAS